MSASNEPTRTMDPFPLEDVELCASDAALQEQAHRRLDALARENMDWFRDEALKRGAPPGAEWVWFTAPEHAWQSEAGTEGWLLYDRVSCTQHAYLLTSMS